jgi:hypothetical protein
MNQFSHRTTATTTPAVTTARPKIMIKVSVVVWGLRFLVNASCSDH